MATFLAAWSSLRRDVRLLAFVLALGIPAQAIIGGITVLTDLNPWVVSFHLLCSLAMIGLSVLFLHRLAGPPPVVSRGPLVALAWVVFARRGSCSTSAPSSPAPVRTPATRTSRATASTRSRSASSTPTRCSCSSACTAGLYFAVRAAGLSLRPLHVLLVVIVLQGAIGFVQYATDVPIVLVGFHMLGAAFVSASVTWVLLSVREPGVGARPRVPGAAVSLAPFPAPGYGGQVTAARDRRRRSGELATVSSARNGANSPPPGARMASTGRTPATP